MACAFFHGRHPVRSRHFRNEDFSILEFVNILRVADDMGFAIALTRACGKALQKNLGPFHGSGRLFFFGLLFLVATGPNSFRTSLKNPDLSIPFINAPFHIHITAIMGFNLFCVSCKFQDLCVCQGLFPAVCFRNRHFHGIAAGLADEHLILFIDRY